MFMAFESANNEHEEECVIFMLLVESWVRSMMISNETGHFEMFLRQMTDFGWFIKKTHVDI